MWKVCVVQVPVWRYNRSGRFVGPFFFFFSRRNRKPVAGLQCCFVWKYSCLAGLQCQFVIGNTIKSDMFVTPARLGRHNRKGMFVIPVVFGNAVGMAGLLFQFSLSGWVAALTTWEPGKRLEIRVCLENLENTWSFT